MCWAAVLQSFFSQLYRHIDPVHVITVGMIDCACMSSSCSDLTMPFCLCLRLEVVRDEHGNEHRVGCHDNCLNRLSYIHCDPRTCPCAADCTNKPFHLLKMPKMEVFLTDNRGHGVRPLQPVKRGQFVVEYAGEVGCCGYVLVMLHA